VGPYKGGQVAALALRSASYEVATTTHIRACSTRQNSSRHAPT